MIQAWINPLSMRSMILSKGSGEKIELALLVSDLCQDSQSSTDAIEAIVKRYNKLSTKDLSISFAPAEESIILEKIIWPLKSAKQAFCLADFLGCIALCGIVCEMAIIFIYKLLASNLNINSLNAEDEVLFFDEDNRKHHEKLTQDQRIKKLKEKKFYVISDERLSDANTVRKIRREYVHFLSKDYAKLEEDAYKTYKSAFRVIKSLVELPLGKSGGLAIPFHLKSYLESKGVFSSNSV